MLDKSCQTTSVGEEEGYGQRRGRWQHGMGSDDDEQLGGGIGCVGSDRHGGSDGDGKAATAHEQWRR